MSRQDEIIQKTVGVLKKQLNPSRIIFFGSRAKGTARYGSDFDFANDVSLNFKELVLTTGKIIYEKPFEDLLAKLKEVS